MLQAAREGVLTLQHLPSRRIAGGSGSKNLERNIDAARLVVRPPDLALASDPDPLDQGVVAERALLSGCAKLWHDLHLSWSRSNLGRVLYSDPGTK